MMTYAKRGFTIIELAVFCGLFVLMLNAVYGVFTYVARFQHIHSATVSAKQNALAGLGEIEQELSESRYSMVVWDTSISGKPMLIFPSPRDADGNFAYGVSGAPTLLWSSYVAYYVDNGVLIRSGQPIASPSAGPPPAPSAASFLNSAAQRPVCRDVASFMATLTAGQPVQLDLTFNEIEYSHSNAVSFETSVYPVNNN